MYSRDRARHLPRILEKKGELMRLMLNLQVLGSLAPKSYQR